MATNETKHIQMIKQIGYFLLDVSNDEAIQTKHVLVLAIFRTLVLTFASDLKHEH
jgi:hypothetical protein